MGRIPDEIIHRIRDAADIVEIVGRHVGLKRAGSSYKGLCPFHHEKTPSFHVSPDRGTFHCFGCGEGGNAISFLMRVENLTFPEAVRSLGRQHGIEVPEVGGGAAGASERLFAATEVAQLRYRQALTLAGNPAAAYLARRGLDSSVVERFGIGFAPDRWDTVGQALRERGLPAEVGERAGLLAPRSSGGFYDRLRGRVVFPIQDVQGRVVAFGGRALGEDQQPKYLNTPETPIFRKREAFYGFPFALGPIRRSERAVVVEGYFDCIALHRAGVEEALATCGTSLTADHARQLRRRTRDVVLLFDGDEAGRKAMERSLEILLPAGLRVRAAELPAGEDPDDFLVRRGAAALRALVDQAPPAIELVIRRVAGRGCHSPWEKNDAVEAVAPLLALVGSPVERGELCTMLALAVGTETRYVEAALRAAARGEDPGEALPMGPRLEGSEMRQLRLLAKVLVDHPEYAEGVELRDFLRHAPRDPLCELISAVLDAGAAELEQELGPEVRPLYYELSAGGPSYDPERGPDIVRQTVERMRARQRRRLRGETTRRIRESPADALELLTTDKRRELEERRLVERPG